MKTLKKILFVIVVMLSSCESIDRNCAPTITAKFIYDFPNNDLPKGICRFYYRNSKGIEIQFFDSCHFYNVLDTIIPKSQRR